MPIKQKLVFLAPVNQSNLVAKVLESLETSEIQMSPSIRQRMLNSLQSDGEVGDTKWHWCSCEMGLSLQTWNMRVLGRSEVSPSKKKSKSLLKLLKKKTPREICYKGEIMQTLQSMGTNSLLETVSSGRGRNCSFF